jgi:hypothetical protein
MIALVNVALRFQRYFPALRAQRGEPVSRVQ